MVHFLVILKCADHMATSFSPPPRLVSHCCMLLTLYFMFEVHMESAMVSAELQLDPYAAC